MTSWKRRIPFRVDIGGVIEILGSALYSRPEAAVRELIQNAHDAIVRRRRTLLCTYSGGKVIRGDSRPCVILLRTTSSSRPDLGSHV